MLPMTFVIGSFTQLWIIHQIVYFGFNSDRPLVPTNELYTYIYIYTYMYLYNILNAI